MSDEVTLDELNHTELLLLAKDINPNVFRQTPRDVLVSIIESDVEPDVPDLPVNKHRLRIMKFVRENWERCGALINCPAKSQDPHACFQCLDLQATECWTKNKHIIGNEKEA